MVEQAGRVDGPVVAAPRWPAALTLGAAVLSVPLTLVNPTVSAVLAVAALAVGVYGNHAARGPAQRIYRLAAGTAVVAIALLVILTLTLYTVDPEPPRGSGWIHGTA
jgi:hypothetical protein